MRLSWTFMTINFFYSPIGYFCFFRFCFPSTRPYNYTFFFLLYVCMLSTDSSSLADGLPRLLPFASRVHFLHNPPPIAADVLVVFSFDRSSARLHVSSPFSFFVFFLKQYPVFFFFFSGADLEGEQVHSSGCLAMMMMMIVMKLPVLYGFGLVDSLYHASHS